jgi:hypothetical protein
MSIKNRILNKTQALTEELALSCPGILKKFPLEKAAENIRFYDVQYFGCTYLSDTLKNKLNRIRAQYSENGKALYHKLLLLTLIIHSLESKSFCDFPKPIQNLYVDWFEMILKDFSSQLDTYYHHDNIPYKIDLAVCSLRAVPIGGAWYAEHRRCRLKTLKTPFPDDNEMPDNIASIKKLVVNRIKRLLIQLNLYETFISRWDNGKPLGSYYFIHTVDRFLPRFTSENMERAYVNIAALLGQSPDIKGIYRKSWFLDPDLKNISPAISFLWEVPQKNGADFFRIGTCGKLFTQKAISMSPVRKKLYEKGEYLPTTYAYIWSREKVLRWAGNKE